MFLRVGGQDGMVVLQEDKDDWPPQHIAFTVAEADIERAAEELRKQGVEVRGPVTHAWRPAPVYIPDGMGVWQDAHSRAVMLAAR